MDQDPKHRRRPRYRGTHPRVFSEKYKELAPEKYPDIVAHVREQGKTPAGQHVPILVDEVLEVLAAKPGERGVDATLGWGGHAQRFLERINPGGRLLALDTDPVELLKAEGRLRRLGFDEDVLLVRRTNFAGIHRAMAEAGWHDGVDFVFADLGVSSMQLDDPARGFSFRADGPLDMRMNPKRGLSAAEWLSRASVETLAAALSENADEPNADVIATHLVAQSDALTSTRALAQAVRDALDGLVSDEDADLSIRRVFQATRIEVNDEFGALDALLRQLPDCLSPGGRVAILTFHSGEDRRVKRAFEEGAGRGMYSQPVVDVIRATAAEQRANPRAKAAKLRVASRSRARLDQPK